MWRTTTSSWRLVVGGWWESRLAARPASPPPTTSYQPPTREAGFTLAALIVILTIISIIVAYTVPSQWSLVMKRERDRQTIFIMRQYARSILKFQQKHQTLPNSMEQLRDARKPRVVRNGGEWVCPLTNEDDWILVPPQAVTAPGMPGAQQQPGPGFVPSQGRLGSNPQWGNTTNNPRNPASNPQPGNNPAPGGPGTPGGMQFSTLNPELSPKGYKGIFVGVRPGIKGQSLIALNGAEDYGEWVFTYQDMANEIAMRNQSLYKQ